ncbi:MAG: GAF domain-containing protein [Gemmatimonadaceae bacterium]
MNRFNLLPDPRFEPLKESLRERVLAAAAALDPENFLDVFDAAMQNVVSTAFATAGADEGTVWLGARKRKSAEDATIAALVPVFNTGPDAARFVGKHRQPIGKGLISGVFAYEQPFCENDVHRNEKQDPTLDRKLGVRTRAMIAVPLYFAGTVRGVISCVQLTRGDADANPTAPRGFTMDDMRQIQFASEILTRLIDHRLVGVTVGWRAE